MGYLCSGGLYIYFGGLSFISVGHLYSGGLILFCWAVLFIYSAEPSTDIVFVSGYKLCVHTLHSILQDVCFIELPCQPSII